MCFYVVMFLRVSQRKKKDGKFVQYYQLAHSERDPLSKIPKTHIIHNFGRADELDKSSLQRLCLSIAKVCELKLEVGEPEEPMEVGLPRNIKQIKTYSFGLNFILEEIWSRLGIKDALNGLCQSHHSQIPHERALFCMVANRLSDPASKLGVWEKWLKHAYLPSCWDLKLDHFYETMDFFHTHVQEIEKRVFMQTANLLNLEVDLIFYDTTVASFAISQEDQEGIRKFGRGKENNWNIQIVIALAVTRDGLPVRSWIFPGNTSDMTTVEKIKADLRDWKLGRSLFVADAGMNSEANRKLLSRGCGKYILAARLSNVEIRDEVLTKSGRYRWITNNLRAKEVVIGDGECRQRYILCFNPAEAERQKLHRGEVLLDIRNELEKHKDRSATAKWAIEMLASGRYKRYVKIEEGKIVLHHDAIKQAAKYDGKWVLQTNDDTISLENAASGYKSLMVIERCFLRMKSAQIELMPMNHRLPNRIEAHVKICVLALLLERTTELLTKASWKNISETMETLQATKYQGENHEFFQINEISEEQKNLLKSLQIPLPKRVQSVKNTKI